MQQRQRQAPTNLIEVRSKSFSRVLDQASQVARFDTSVLITGESGVGKEVLAQTYPPTITTCLQHYVNGQLWRAPRNTS